MKKLVLAGIEGKMGRFLYEGLQKEPDLEIVAGVGQAAKMHQKVPIYNDLSQLIVEVDFDIYLDFTIYEFSKVASAFMIKNNKPIIVGTTGFLETDISHLKELAHQYGGRGIIAPNFSLGAILIGKFAGLAADYFKHFSVHEYHHHSKVDNPSGTALYIGNIIDQSLKETAGTTPVYGIRLPGMLATHHVMMSDETQKLELIHQSNNRHSFEQGVILAISRLAEIEGLIYGLESVLN